jgi:uracil-DNA glycosylase family 4
VEYRQSVAQKKKRLYQDWVYWGKPVPAFGDFHGRILVVGLAPGPHGSNRTGRMFTGDSSGRFLYRALHKAGFANQPTSDHTGDGLALTGLVISAACRCAPPDNKPKPDEIANCAEFLKAELRTLRHLEVIVALGKIGFDQALRMLRELGKDIPRLNFGHGVVYPTWEGGPWLVASYHPSQQNTQTGRLTEAMFDEVWARVRGLLE